MFAVPTPPRFAVPAGSCDCHVHLFGPYARFPLAPHRLYTPDTADVPDLFAMLQGAGVERAVLVQPSAYGTDNACVLDALARHPARLRGVAVIDPDLSDAELERMTALGVRGTRLNLASTRGVSGAETARMVERLAARIAAFGWHLQMFVTLDIIDAIAPMIARLPVDVVFDHMGMAEAARGPSQPGFDSLLRLLGAGKTWVKLSGPYRVSPDEHGNAGVTALARAFVKTNKERVVWASDWPHLGPHAHAPTAEPPHADYRAIDYGRLLSVAADWADGDDLHRLLVRNPAKLYDFA
jgi:predicted TIM-barrel fold metal-dependent hydrolase